MTAIRRLAPICALLIAGGCEFDVPDYNAQSINALEQGATPTAINTASVGLLVASRNFNSSFLTSYVASAGEFGREGMELDPSNAQHPVDRLNQIGSSEPDYAGYGRAYILIKQANTILTALPGVSGMTDQQKEAVRGFAKTFQALAFLRLNAVFDNSGVPVDVDIPTSAPLAPIASNAEVKARIVQLLDQAKTHLTNGGTAFPFKLSSGFAGFDTPVGFLKFNRALRARIAVYQQDWTGALTALGESFISTTASLRLGVYDTYSPNQGELANPLYDPTCRQLFSISQNETEAQLQPDGVTLDQRYVDKIQNITPKVVVGIPVAHCFKIYSTSSTPIPIIRNEELILLRAEAELQTGARASALTDINIIRVNSGRLAPLAADPGDPGLLDELLYNRRYSLMWEGGHRWIDARRYDRLAQLPKALPTHFVFPHLPLPLNECNPRQNVPPGCKAPPGI